MMKTDLVVAGYIYHNDKVLLVHHKKLDLWLPVGGHIDANETPDDALHREVKEETGMDIEILNQNSIPVDSPVKKNLADRSCCNSFAYAAHVSAGYNNIFYQKDSPLKTLELI